MQNWNQWQVPSGNTAVPMPQPPVGFPATGQDPMATMQAYMHYYNQPAPTGYTTEQWAAAQQQNWSQWSQWQHQYQQWQTQYGDKYQETMKQYSTNSNQQPPMPSSQPPLPKDDSTKPPLPPDPSGSYGFANMPPPHQNNLPLFPTKSNSGQDVNPPLPTNPPLPPDLNSSVSDSKSSVESESAKKIKLDEEKMIEIEKTFDAQFKQWEEQFNTWKQKNANHPDKEQYKQYEAKWTSWREKLLERREQMRRKREQQKQTAKTETEKKDGDKIMNILSSTENQGLINNLLGIGKTLGLTGKQEAAPPTASTALGPAPNQSSVSSLQNVAMTQEMNQQSWAAQQWAQQYNANYSEYQVPPPPKSSQNMSIPPPNFSQQPPSFTQQTSSFSSQSSSYMQPPPNFAQPPPSFNTDQKMYNKPPPFSGQNNNPGANKSEMSGADMLKRKEEMDSHKDSYNDNMNETNRRMDGNRFSQPNRSFSSGNDSFNPNRFESNYNQNQFSSERFNKGNDWFGSDKTDRFSSGNRFSGSNDRFSSGGGGFGKNQSESPRFDSELAPELRKLMEKRRSAMDAFRPRTSFLDPEKTLNVGSLRESFKKITGDTLFRPRSFGGNDDSSSFGNLSSFGPRGSSFGPRGFNEFEPRSSSFGPRGPASFAPRGPSNFNPRINSFAPFAPSHPIEQKCDAIDMNLPPKMDEPMMDSQNKQRMMPKDLPMMEPPKMPEMLKDEVINKEKILEDDVVIISKESEQNSDIEIIHSSTDNKPPDNSWIKTPQSKIQTQLAEQRQEPSKNENLPFMGDDDPKPTDLNMEPPPDFPNLGPVIQTPMDPPPAFIEHPFSQEEFPKDFGSRPFEPFAPRGPPPFGMRGPNNFAPKGMNQPFNQNNQFGPRGMSTPFKPTFGPRGMDSSSFSPRGNLQPNQQFGPRGQMNQSFGPRMDKPSPFGPRGVENSPFSSPFGNRPPFGNRDSFQDQSNDPSNRIPSLFELKFDPTFKKSEDSEPQQSSEMDFADDNFESSMEKPGQSFKQDMPRSFNQQDLPKRDWNQSQSYDEQDFTPDNDDVEMSQHVEQESEPMDTRQNAPDSFSQHENGSNYDPFEIFKNRRKKDAEMRKPPVEFCAKTQFNYNHGVGPMSKGITMSQGDRSQGMSIHDHIPVKVIDYQHSKRRVQELLTTIESYDYGHGSLKPTIPDQIQSLRKDFRNWEESEQNLREYSERLKDWEYESHQKERFLARDFRMMRKDKAWREEMVYRENKFKRRQQHSQWDADVEFKRMRYERDYGYHHDKKDSRDRKYQDKSYADDDILEEISWDGDNDRSLKDFSEDTKKEDNSNLDTHNGADPSKKLDITKTTTCTTVDNLLCMPGRQNRPPKIVIILRGPPGSGKSFIAKLIKDKEVEQGGSAPRILSIDDYFLVEKEVETTDDNGKKISTKEMVYEYEEVMESSYTASLGKAFKKNITDGFFNFIILDSINEKITDYEELWSFAKSKGFKVYVCEMEMDPQICLKRNVHKRSEDEINRIIDYFEPTPSHHHTLDVNSMLQEQDIKDVEMEDNDESEINESLKDQDQDSQEDSQNPAPISKWETMDAEDKLDRLDGLTKHKHDGNPQTMEDFLQVPDYYDMEDTSGKKRVRWADLEERKEQEKMRAVGFVVGHTNWDRMMDPTKGSSALTRTKYI